MDLKKIINDNSYKIELPSHIHTHLTFNVQDLSDIHGEIGDDNSWTSSISPGEDDAVS